MLLMTKATRLVCIKFRFSETEMTRRTLIYAEVEGQKLFQVERLSYLRKRRKARTLIQAYRFTLCEPLG